MLQTAIITKAYYHSLMCNLPDHKRAFLDPTVDADKYYVVYKGSILGCTIGAFGTTARGYLTGLFALKPGYGKEIFKVREAQAIMDLNPKLSVTHLELFCAGGVLKGFFESQGYKVEHSFDWDDKLAHSYWDYSKYGKPELQTMIKDL